MKTLFMLLALSFMAFGQDNTIKAEPFPSSIHINAISLDDLISYQKECYADSEHVKIHPYKHWQICTSYNGEECEDESHYTWVWRHREPTFQGFIEYLKKEYGVK